MTITRSDRVAGLREQITECKAILTKEETIEDLWESKMQYTFVLDLLEKLKTVRDGPKRIDYFVDRKWSSPVLPHPRALRPNLRLR